MKIEPTAAQVQIRDSNQMGMLVVAPAGCGKSEALALRVQGMLRRGVATGARRVLVATFSNRAKDNIRERLRHYLTPAELRDKVTVINFHGLSARLYRSHAAAIGLDPEWTLPENDWVKEQCQRAGLNYGQAAGVDKVLQRLKQDPVSDTDVLRLVEAHGNVDALQIEQLRVRDQQLTYDDLPRMAELILARDVVADLYRVHFTAVVVDEFQDLTPQQLRIINRIGAGRTTYAGDLAQGIYGFTGAKPEEVYAQITHEVGEVVQLTESHRSSPAVLAAVTALVPLTHGTALTCAAPDTWPSGGIAVEVSHQTADAEAGGSSSSPRPSCPAPRASASASSPASARDAGLRMPLAPPSKGSRSTGGTTACSTPIPRVESSRFWPAWTLQQFSTRTTRSSSCETSPNSTRSRIRRTGSRLPTPWAGYSNFSRRG